jgi:NAD(P)-dependent dehydrogenase (short-subunit alcohol dehydrogenase family)
MTKTVVITGANRGLGLELARAYASRGDKVIAGCRMPSTATELAAVTPHVHPLDVGDERSINAFVTAFGDRTVDILINNAGIDARNLGVADGDRDVLTQSGDHVLDQIRVNAVGPMLVARGLVANLRRSDSPRIVNVSSQVGSMVVGAGMGRDVGYAVSKAALNMITVKLAARLTDDGIIALALHPGYLRTQMGGASAPLGPDQSAAEIVQLVDSLTIEDSGSFRRWDGTEHPW